jgi:tRNA (cmo5U34)-methyltransferase
MSTQQVDFDRDNAPPADQYEQLARKFIPGYDGLYALMQILIAEKLPEQAEILVVGAGGGKEILTLGRAFPTAKFTGVDPSEKMLAVAQGLIEQAGIAARVTLHQGTVDQLEAKQFDAATTMLVMHFLPDDETKLNFLKDIHDRLKPGARFILADGCLDKQAADYAWHLNCYQAHAKLNGVPEEILVEAVKMISEHVHFVSEERELELLRAAGFAQITRFFQALWVRAWTMVRE